MKSLSESVLYANSKEYEKLLRSYFTEINPARRERLKQILLRAIRSNATIADTARMLNPIFDNKERSELVARTEIIRLTNEGNRIRMQSEGTKKVEWISAPEDGRLCENCAKRDGKIYSIKDIKGEIPLHPRCRCTFTEV